MAVLVTGVSQAGKLQPAREQAPILPVRYEDPGGLPDSSYEKRNASRLRARPRRPRAQSQERGSGDPSGRPGGVYRRFGVGKVIAGLRHALRGGAAAVPGIGLSLRSPAVSP